MLLFANKLGVHWYFRLAVNTVDNRDILSNYITFKEMFPSIFIVDDRYVDMLIKSIRQQLHLNLQINKYPILKYILQKYSCNVFQADIFLYFLK